jgi:fatty-acyl-CoA synthase
MDGIAKWIEKRAFITPQRMALMGERRELTYAEMNGEVNRIARLLVDRYRMQPQERVGILANNGIEYLLLLFAIAKLGLIAVVLNHRLTPHELEYQTNDSGVKLLIADSCFRHSVDQFIRQTGVERVLWFDPSGSSAERLEEQAASCPPECNTAAGVDGSSPFVICYTSGTTGRPKGAVLTQENMFWNAVNNCLSLDITSADRVLTVLPLFHIGGIGLFALPALFAGGTVIVPDRFDPEKVLHLIEERRATIIMGVPTMLDLLRKSPRFAATDFRSVRWFYSGGAPCPHELISFYLDHGIPLGQGYGMTETSPTVFMLSKEDYRRKIGSIGKPAMFCDIRIVDEQGRDVAAGEVGELLVRGPNVMQGYWNLPEATAAAIRDGWLSTGDLVRADEEGFVYIAGRKKDMIISGGENVYPLEIEQVIGELPEIDEVAVLGMPDEKWGEVPVAVIAVKQAMQLDQQTVRFHCQKRLAKYKVPACIHFVSALPKNATGKIDKKALRNQIIEKMEWKKHG